MANALHSRASVTSIASSSEETLADNYRSVNHSKSVLETLKELRDDAMLCDIILRVDDQSFPAHKCVLVAFSPYFKAMFTGQLKESQDREVTLNDIEPSVLEDLLQFAYTGSVSITQANVESLMAASNLLQVLWVRDACSQFMEKHMDASNCLGIRFFAETMNCEGLQEVAKTFALSNFTDVATHEEFLNLPRTKLVELVSSDALDVPREEDVFTAVLNWFNHQPDSHKEEFHKVLENVRLPLLSPSFLHDSVASLEMIRSSLECNTLLIEAIRYQHLPERRRDMQGARTRPRGNEQPRRSAQLVDVTLLPSGVSTRPRRNAVLVDVIVCVGGNAGRDLDCVEAFEPASNQWISLANLPYAVQRHGCVMTGKNVMYVAGGISKDRVTNKLLAFYPQANKWEEMTGMSCARQYLGMAVLDGFVYVVGGRAGRNTLLDSVERFNTETNIWEEMPGLKTCVETPAVVAHDGYLYVAGGHNGREPVACVQRFDPSTRTWSEVAPMLSPRRASVACVLDGKLYVIGGCDGTLNPVNTVECYDSHHDQWSPCSRMRAARSDHGAVVINGHIYVFGGRDDSYTPLKSVECYTPSADRWEDVTDMTSGRDGLMCAVLQVPRSLLVSGKRLTTYGL